MDERLGWILLAAAGGLVAGRVVVQYLRQRGKPRPRTAPPDVEGAPMSYRTAPTRPDPAELPGWHAATVYVLAPLIPALLAGLYLGTKHPDSALRWNLTQMTLGVFRVSYAEGMLDPDSWGSPDLVYYDDGLTTTVSVERWGRHYALKNNGKVDASNGDDMPTQINVAAYPLLLHSAGPTDLGSWDQPTPARHAASRCSLPWRRARPGPRGTSP